MKNAKEKLFETFSFSQLKDIVLDAKRARNFSIEINFCPVHSPSPTPSLYGHADAFDKDNKKF